MAVQNQSTDEFCAALFRLAPVEFRLLAACCRWPLESARPAIAALLAHRSVDWKLLLALGNRHRVNGFLAAALRLQEGVPDAVRSSLAQHAERIERENLLHVAVAVGVMRALEAAQTPAVILKGAPLSQVIYGNIGVRHSKDIDLLVEEKQLSSVEALLLQNGFNKVPGLTEGLTPKQARAFERFRKHHDFKHAATGCQLELHWRAYDNLRLGTISPLERDWVECSPGIRLPTLHREELFPLLCAHGAGHAWFRLKWLADVAALLAQSSPEEQAQLWESAQKRGLERPAEQAILLCRGLFEDARLPSPPQSSGIGRWLATVARNALQEEIKGKSSEAEFVPKRLAVSRLLLRRGWQYKFAEVKLNAASPADWKALPLPGWLHFIYPFLRVPLWFGRRWRGRQQPGV